MARRRQSGSLHRNSQHKQRVLAPISLCRGTGLLASHSGLGGQRQIPGGDSHGDVTLKRTEAARELAKKVGVTMRESFWTLGAYDVMAVFEAPDDETMTAFSLSAARLGNIKTQTLRAFSDKEMSDILAKAT